MTEKRNPTLPFFNLPLEIFNDILSFLSEQERQEIVLTFRLVSKAIMLFLNNNAFLMQNAPILFMKKNTVLQKTFNRPNAIHDQVQEWKNIEAKIKETYQGVYKQLPYVEKIYQLLDDIKNTPFPYNHGYTKLKALLAPRKAKIYLALLIASTIVAIYLNAFELPKAANLRQEQNKIADQLRAEGCIISRPYRGDLTITHCSDTAKKNKYFELDDQYDRYSLPGILFDTFYLVELILVTVYAGGRYLKLPNNVNSYTQLNISKLSSEHKQLSLEIQEQFPDSNLSNLNTIEDLVNELTNIISKCILPLAFKNHTLLAAVHQNYFSLLAKLETEISTLMPPANTNQKPVNTKKVYLSSNLTSGESKAGFRNQIYTFFADCNQVKKLCQDKPDKIIIEEMQLVEETTLLINHTVRESGTIDFVELLKVNKHEY